MDLDYTKTYEEQLEVIRDKGFIILNEDEESSKDFLQRTNYYRVYEYFQPILNANKTRKVNFKQVQKIYEFDSRLRNLISLIIEDIEISIRAHVSHHIAHTYGGYGYLDEDIFNNKHRHNEFIDRVSRCIKENHKLLTKHNKSTSNIKVPIWYIIEYFSIGMLSHFYIDLNTKDKKLIAKNLGINTKNLESWLRCITDLRNKCAHYSRIYFWTFSALPRMPKHLANYKERGLFRQLIMLREMYPYKSDWNTKFATPLQALVSNYQEDILLDDMGFPENWEDILFI